MVGVVVQGDKKPFQKTSAGRRAEGSEIPAGIYASLLKWLFVYCVVKL